MGIKALPPIFVGEEISIPETQLIEKSYISLWIPIKSCLTTIFFYNLQEKRKLMDLKILEDHQSSLQPLLSPALSYKKDRVVTWRQDSLQLKIQISKLSGSRMVNHCLLDTDSGTFSFKIYSNSLVIGLIARRLLSYSTLSWLP